MRRISSVLCRDVGVRLRVGSICEVICDHIPRSARMCASIRSVRRGLRDNTIANDTKRCMLPGPNPMSAKVVGRRSVVWMRSTDICVRKVAPSVDRQLRLYSKHRLRSKPQPRCRSRVRSRWGCNHMHLYRGFRLRTHLHHLQIDLVRVTPR